MRCILFFSKFLFYFFFFFFFFLHVEEEVSAFNFFLLSAILIFLSLMTNNQTKYGVIYEKIAMLAGDDEQR